MRVGILICVLLVPACFADNLVELATSLGATTLVSYLKAAGLESALSANGPFTVFGPTNAAFDALPDDVKAALTKDTALLKKVLMFHVINQKAYSSQLSNNMIVPSLDMGLSIRVNIYGKTVTVDGAKVVMVDQNATNGVIHVIDRVMYPLPSGRIPETVVAQPELSTLLYAVAQATLAGALSGDGPLTLFAPTNAAFDRLPAGALSDLLSNQTALIAVLKYHVVMGADYSAGLSSGMVKTLEGRSINVTVSAAGVMVNSAKVIMADIPAINGVVHEIDNVLLPPA